MITLYGATWCPDCTRSKAYLDQKKVPYTYVDLELDPTAADTVEKLNKGLQSIPTIVFSDGSILTEPTDSELGAKIADIEPAT
ncbi:MAG: glutaredoxin domain-containing protein [bacterium]